MEELFEGFPEEIRKWESLRDIDGLDIEVEPSNDPNESGPSVQLLPRQDVTLYGTIPKMEPKVYAKCKECKLVFNPRDVVSHAGCSGRVQSSSAPQSLKKKVKNKGSTSKKSQSSLPPPPLFKKPPSPLATASTSSATVVSEPKLPTTKVSPKIPKISTVSASTSTHTVTTATTKSETRVTASSSSTHTSKSSSVHSPKSPSKSVPSSVHSPKPSSKTTSTEISAASSTSSSSSNSGSRYKKSRKSSSSTKITKEFDPDVHCGVVEGTRGPCTRSITCSNHRIQLRKLVPGRSKDIHQLIAERKAAKEKELKPSTSGYTSPNGAEEKDIVCQSTSYVPMVATVVSNTDSASPTTYVPIMPKPSNSPSNRQPSTSIITAKQLNMTDMENNSSKTLDGGYIANMHNSSQESAMGTVPVVYMPMSPISVVSPVQFVQIGKNMICLESPQSAMSPPLTANQSVFLTIPSQQTNIKLYKSHPKPVTIPTYGTKKVGGAILLSNQRIECQRNNILMAINTKCETVTNILKVKSVNKVNCKRPAVDKLTSDDNKQMRLSPNVNGFILHSDISETADAPQSNNCIQEKIALLNMK